MAEHVEGSASGLREGIGEIRRDLSRERIEGRLEEVVEDKPIVRHLLDLGIVLRAVVIGFVVALISWLLVGPRFAAVLLIVSFFVSWLALTSRDYNRRRPTTPVDDDETDG